MKFFKLLFIVIFIVSCGENNKEIENREAPTKVGNESKKVPSSPPLKTEKFGVVESQISNILFTGCQDNGFAYHSCNFSPKIIKEKINQKETFIINLSIKSCGKMTVVLGIEDQDSGGFFPFSLENNNKESVKVSGLGPFMTKILNPDEFDDSYFPKSCSIEIDSITIIKE